MVRGLDFRVQHPSLLVVCHRAVAVLSASAFLSAKWAKRLVVSFKVVRAKVSRMQ